MSVLLAVDMGNTRVKWGLARGGEWLAQGAVVHGEAASLADAWAEIARPDRALVSNVAGTEAAARLDALLEALKVPHRYVESTARCCGVRNGYARPGQLGVDRWAALVGAWHLTGHGCIVINAGTALTVDALSDEGVFLGGIIVPGAEVMRRSLARDTAGLEIAEGEFERFPTSTENAIETGVVLALVGAVERMAEAEAGECALEPLCLVSGGGAGRILPHLRLPTRHVDNLVLEGLARMGMEDVSR